MSEVPLRAVTPVTLFLMILVGSLAFGRSLAQEPVADSNEAQTPSDIARLQVERGTVVQLPVKGKVKLSLKEDSPTFPMPGGMSSVVLLRLPDYQGDYDLHIVSSQSGRGRTTEIFVPSGIHLDDKLQTIGEWGEEGLQRKDWRIFKFLRPVGDMRYLLLYSRGEWLGLHLRLDLPGDVYGVQVPGKTGLFLGNPFNFFRLKRSLRGHIQVETKPLKRD